MKKLWIALLAVFLLLGLCSLAAADELSFVILEDGTAELSSYSSENADIVVPDKLGGCPVTVIGESCSSMQSVQLPATVTVIGKSAFSGCDGLTSVTLPAKLKSIGDYAFYECTSLSALVIPDTVTEIGESAFSGSGLTEITVPVNAAKIGDEAFSSCSQLTKVTVRSSLAESGTSLFKECSALTSVTFGEGAVAVPESMFEECAQLTDVTLPKSLLSVENDAFYDCDALAAVTLPANVTAIGNYAFAYCDALSSVTLPANLETIGENAFYECASLAEITIPDKTVSIGDAAFNSCGSLQKIVVPDSVTEIGESSFWYLNENAWIVVGRDSYAAAYCTENDIRLRYRDGSPRLSYFGDVGSISGMLAAADNAVQLGEKPAEIYQELLAEAKEYDLYPWLEYQLENMAAYGSAGYEKLAAMNEDSSRSLYTYYSSSYRAEGAGSGLEVYSNYDVESYSDEFRAMIADKGAQFCAEPMVWAESECSSTSFTPSRPRAGYICVIVRKGAENNPGSVWTPANGGPVNDLIDSVLPELMDYIDANSPDSLPVITGNPHLASIFLVFDVRYTFYANYGSAPEQIKGYNTTAKVTAVNAVTHKTISEISGTCELGDTIYYWGDDGIATADLPVLTGTDTFSVAFAAPVLNAIRLQDCELYAGRVLTGSNAGIVLNAVLLKQTVGKNDPWQNAIYSSGAQEISLDEENPDTVTFSLRGFDPKTETLGAFASAESRVEWLRSALGNSKEYVLTLTLPLQSGKLTEEAMATLTGEVAAAAEKAQQEYTGEDMTAALTYWLLPSPVDGDVQDAALLLDSSDAFQAACDLTQVAENDSLLDYQDLAIAIYATNGVTLNFSGGPCAVVFSGNGADPSFVTETADALLEELAFKPEASRPSLYNLEDELNLRLAEKAIQFHAGTKTAFSFTVNPDDLTNDETPLEYRQYLSSFPFNSAYSSLYSSCSSLPDAAAIPFPSTGLLSEKRKGTSVHIVIPSTADATYIQMRSEDTNEIVATAFIHPGKRVDVKVPSGDYRLLYCSGPYWYGEELLFGDNGIYKQSDVLNIKDARYEHTLTLETSKGGGVGVSDASQSDFQ